jgi:hypothetical protein
VTAALASFIESPAGRFYGRVCAATGYDPGAAFDDDVIAFQVRAAYAIRDAEDQQVPPGGVRTDLDARIREMNRGR